MSKLRLHDFCVSFKLSMRTIDLLHGLLAFLQESHPIASPSFIDTRFITNSKA